MKLAIVTGAGGGIGRELLRELFRADYEVLGVELRADVAARVETQLRSESVNVRILAGDLTDPNGRERLLEALRADANPVSVCIHNAGYNAVGRFADIPASENEKLLAVNLTAPMLLTRSLLAERLLGPNASLVFMSSLSTYVGYPGASVYGAAKTAIAHYARSLAAARPDLHILRVFPGPVRTPMAARCSPIEKENAERRRMLPERLAEQIVRAIGKRKRVLVPGLGNRALARLCHWAPFIGEFAMRKAIYEKLERGQVKRSI